jgi:hypothetical protein
VEGTLSNERMKAMGLTDAERQEIRRLLAEARPKRRPPLAPVPAPNVKAQERFNEANKPTVAVIDEATRSNDAFARRIAQERKEMAQWNDPRARYQRELDRWWQSKLDAEAALDDDYVYVGGFRERRRQTTCHKGKGDPDYGM